MNINLMDIPDEQIDELQMKAMKHGATFSFFIVGNFTEGASLIDAANTVVCKMWWSEKKVLERSVFGVGISSSDALRDAFVRADVEGKTPINFRGGE